MRSHAARMVQYLRKKENPVTDIFTAAKFLIQSADLNVEALGVQVIHPQSKQQVLLPCFPVDQNFAAHDGIRSLAVMALARAMPSDLQGILSVPTELPAPDKFWVLGQENISSLYKQKCIRTLEELRTLFRKALHPQDKGYWMDHVQGCNLDLMESVLRAIAHDAVDVDSASAIVRSSSLSSHGMATETIHPEGFRLWEAARAGTYPQRPLSYAALMIDQDVRHAMPLQE